jgi:hypothetical protein
MEQKKVIIKKSILIDKELHNQLVNLRGLNHCKSISDVIKFLLSFFNSKNKEVKK